MVIEWKETPVEKLLVHCKLPEDGGNVRSSPETGAVPPQFAAFVQKPFDAPLQVRNDAEAQYPQPMTRQTRKSAPAGKGLRGRGKVVRRFTTCIKLWILLPGWECEQNT
jgi:hypothetical protein